MEDNQKNENGFFAKLFKRKSGDSQNSSRLRKLKLGIAAILMIVIVIIFLSSFVTEKSGSTSNSGNTSGENSLAMEYCQQVENRLINVLKTIKGIGNVDVFVMVDSSPTIKYLEETSKTSATNKDNGTESIQTTIVLAKNGTITSPVVVVEMLPKITGVLVVATGAKDVKLKTTLINVVSSVLNVNVSNVEVLEGK